METNNEAPATTFNRWLDRFLEETNKFELDPALVSRLRFLTNSQGGSVKHRVVGLDFRNASGAEFVKYFHWVDEHSTEKKETK